MAKLLGKWQHESNVNTEQFMREMEFLTPDKLKQVMAEADQWMIEIKKDGNKWTIIETSPSTPTHTFTFESGKEFMESDNIGDTGDYRTVVNIDSDNQMTQKHYLTEADKKTVKNTMTTVRELKPDGKMHIRIDAPDFSSSSIYYRV